MVTPPDTPRTSYGHPTDKELDTTDKEPGTTDKEPDILRTRNRTSYGHPTDILRTRNRTSPDMKEPPPSADAGKKRHLCGKTVFVSGAFSGLG